MIEPPCQGILYRECLYTLYPHNNLFELGIRATNKVAKQEGNSRSLLPGHNPVYHGTAVLGN